MARTRASAKTAGSTFERVIADTLAEHVDDRIDRRPKMGAKDRGDIGGVRLSPALRGGRAVIECKDVRNAKPCANCGRKSPTLDLGGWYREADIERGNDDAVTTAVFHKRTGKAAGLDQWATMTVRDYCALLTGERPA